MQIDNMLLTLYNRGGSDLHIQPKMVPRIRVEGRLLPLQVSPPTTEDVNMLLESMGVKPLYMGQLYDNLSTDFRYQIATGQSFRVNIVESENGKKLTFRNLSKRVPSIDKLGYEPGLFDDIIEMPHGLVIISGTTNSGKSTTLASLIQEIALRRTCNIITLEDPIEYVFNQGNAILTRRELGVSFQDYPTAIRDAMRQDPDVIMVGEMRDPDTIRATILLAETGHLVLSTLHNNTIETAEDRALLVFNSDERDLITTAFRKSLRFLMAQRLVVDETTNKLKVEYDYLKY